MQQQINLQELFKIFRSSGNNELEVRFGKFNDNGFKPELQKEDFDSLISFFEKFKLKTESSSYEQITYQCDYRERIFSDGKTEYCLKKKISKIDDIENGMRFAVSEEIICEKNNKNKKITRKVNKERQSFFLEPNFRLDFTSDGNQYDIELECVNKDCSTEEFMKDIIKHTVFLCKFIHKSNVLCSFLEKKYNLSYFEGLKIRFNNCKNLKRRDINTNLLFTEKIDGERNFMLINGDGEGYLVNNAFKVRKVGVNFGKHMSATVFDTECVYNIETGLVIYIFDILMLNGKHSEENLPERLNIIKKIIGLGNGVLKIKKYFNDKQNLSGLIEKNSKSSDLDGIIFSTTNSCYKNTTHLKWKPKQTVDLKVSNEKLYAYDKNNNDYKVDFEIIYSDYKIQDGSVAEFIVDKNGKLTFLRQRSDKSKGNFIGCVIDIVEDAKNNISEDELINLYSIVPEQPKYEFRNFHNFIKKQLYNTYVSKTDTLLELACGKAGDIHKWNCSYVLGVDNNKKFLENAKIRNEKAGKNCDFKFLDLSSQVILDEYPEVCFEKFDVCSIQFAIHYLFQSQETFDNLLKNINCSLKQGGYVIGTCMDEKMLVEMDNSLFSLKLGEKSEANFGNEVFVNFNDINASSEGILRGGNKEYIVKNLKQIMESNGFIMVEMKNFKQYMKGYKVYLTTEEKIFSSMNTTFVFIKK